MRTYFVVLAALVILFPTQHLDAQLPEFSVVARGGGGFPVASDFFKRQWANGYNAGINVGYNIENSLKVGGAIEYDYFQHTAQCVFGADREFLCVSGYGQYSLTTIPQLLYTAVYAGLGYDYLGEVVRGVNSDRYINSAKTSVSPMLAVFAGTEIPVARNFSLDIEAGWTFIYGTFADSNFMVARAGVMVRI